MCVEQTFQHDVAREAFIEPEIDPAQAAISERPLHLVLVRDHLAWIKGWKKRILLAALAAKSGLTLERRVASGTEAFCSGTLGSGMIAFSGSVEGRSGRVMSPAPSCLRLVREEEWLVRRVPFAARLTGDDPVPVVMWLEVRVETGAAALCPVPAAAAVLDFGSASPQILQ